jgi:hypothetical protein
MDGYADCKVQLGPAEEESGSCRRSDRALVNSVVRYWYDRLRCICEYDGSLVGLRHSQVVIVIAEDTSLHSTQNKANGHAAEDFVLHSSPRITSS